MLTNALRSNSSFRFERNISPTKRPQAVILPIGGNAEVGGRARTWIQQVWRSQGLRLIPRIRWSRLPPETGSGAGWCDQPA